jgi:hypothetical protein
VGSNERESQVVRTKERDQVDIYLPYSLHSLLSLLSLVSLSLSLSLAFPLLFSLFAFSLYVSSMRSLFEFPL